MPACIPCDGLIAVPRPARRIGRSVIDAAVIVASCAGAVSRALRVAIASLQLSDGERVTSELAPGCRGTTKRLRTA